MAQQPSIDEAAEHLLDEQRVPFRSIDDESSGPLGQRGAEGRFDQLDRLRCGQGFQPHGLRVVPARPPARARIDEVGSGRPDQQEGAPDLASELFDQVEEGSLGPVKVFH